MKNVIFKRTFAKHSFLLHTFHFLIASYHRDNVQPFTLKCLFLHRRKNCTSSLSSSVVSFRLGDIRPAAEDARSCFQTAAGNLK